MSQSVRINNVTYSGVPSVQIPLSSGSGSATFYETSNATASASDILAGAIAYGSSGAVTGTLTTPAVSQDSTTKVLSIS